MPDGADIAYDFLIIAFSTYKNWDASGAAAEFDYSMYTNVLVLCLGGGIILAGLAPKLSGTCSPEVFT